MHAKDQVGSITYGLTPQENLVAGTDILIASMNNVSVSTDKPR